MRFKRVYIEITNACNLSCRFCIKNDRPIHNMTIEEFSSVISQVKPYTNYVYLHILGEPLSHPHLLTFLDICKDANIKVNITTNGTLLKKRGEELCHPSLRQLNISLHSFPEHEQRDYLKDICTYSRRLAEHNIHVNLRLWSLENGALSKDSESLLEQVCAYFQVEKPAEIKRLKRFDLEDYIHLHFEEVFQWPSLKHPYVSDTGRCLGMKMMCGILSDGTLVPCCLDSKKECNLGNVFITPLKDLLESEKVKLICKGFDENRIEEELCKHCSYRLRFSKGKESF